MAQQPRSLLVSSIERPSLSRTRSNTSPAEPQRPVQDAVSNGSERVSQDSARDLRPAEPRTQPLRSPSQLLAPGTSGNGREHRQTLRHRHTRSDQHGGRSKSHLGDTGDGPRHLAAAIAAEHRRGEGRLPFEKWSSRQYELRRIASHRSDKDRYSKLDGGPEMSSLQATKSESSSMQDRSEIEMLLDKADAEKRLKRATASMVDVELIQKCTEEAEKELQGRLATVSQTAIDMTQKLDSTYYNLLERVGSLAALVQSFQNLRTQMNSVLDTFQQEASTLDGNVTAKVETLRTRFDEREKLVMAFEDRGALANAKAQDLSARLDRARQRIDEREKRDGADRRRRSRNWKMIWTILLLMLMIMFFSLTWREWKSDAEMVKMAVTGNDDLFGHWNQSSVGTRGRSARVGGDPGDPDEVRKILKGGNQKCPDQGMSSAESKSRSDCDSDTAARHRGIDALDDLLRI